MPKDKPGPNQTGKPTKVSSKLLPSMQKKVDAVQALSGKQNTVRLANRLVRTKTRRFRMN